MDKFDTIEYWKKRVVYYQRKYGKNSNEAEAAKLNLERVTPRPHEEKGV